MIVIGIDAGTSVIKATAFDDDGAIVASAARPNRVLRPRPGWSEQDMAATVAVVADAVSEVAASLAAPPDALALTAQGDGAWLATRDLIPAGPAMLWNDSRASDIFDGWWRDGVISGTFGITGSVGGPGSPHALLRWLRRHEPDRLPGSVLLSCGGWLFGSLTGRLIMERSESCSPFGDLLGGGWSQPVLEAFGLGWAEELLPPVAIGDDRVGSLSNAAAARLGLPAGLPVVHAPYDVVSTAHGAGAIESGEAVIILGTTLCAEMISQSPRLDRSPSGVTLSAGVPGHWVISEPALTGTDVLEWAAGLLGVAGPAELSELAETSALAADGPLFLPYLAPGGERAPFYDPAITGSLVGVRSWHSRADMALAVFEGLSLAAADAMAAAGRPSRIMLAGGGRASELWCRQLAGACGVPVQRVTGDQPGAGGAAMFARVLLGWDGWADLRRWSVPRQPGGDRVWIPDQGQSAVWAARAERFTQVRAGLQSLGKRGEPT